MSSSRRIPGFMCGVLLVVQLLLVAWMAYRHSPVLDDVGHLPAGISYWRFGTFEIYRVNPPLTRLAAALPTVLSDANVNWSSYRRGPTARPEWSLGRDFINANPADWNRYFVFGRWALIPFVLLGGYICFRWARELYGVSSGLLALTLWVFSPNVLAWSATICPDAAAAAMGVLAGYCFWKWLKQPNWKTALVAGLTLGLVELTKMTWFFLFGLWPLLWLGWVVSRRIERTDIECWKQARQLLVILLGGLYVLNLGYGFEGSFQRLGDFTFVSRTLAGADSVPDEGLGGNRFTDTWLGAVPVPLPSNYLSGIDLQKIDFERGKLSYLNGEWKETGWWYYYLIALLLKVPLGTWLLALLAAAVTLCQRGYSAGCRDELTLLLPAAAVLILVSSQTGFSRYLRYVLPCFPFAFIWVSKVARCIDAKHWKLVGISAVALVWSVGSSLWIYPHSMSYFNELAGGPQGGHRYLLDANIEWGQDLWYLKEWYDEHPQARPLQSELHSFVDLEHFDIESTPPPRGPNRNFDRIRLTNATLQTLGPLPGWYAMGVHRIHDRNGDYEYFQRFDPVATAGYSISIYHITPQAANRVRKELGLPPLVD